MLVTVVRGHMAVRAGQVVYSRSSSCDAERSPPCDDEETRLKAFVSVAPRRMGRFRAAPGGEHQARAVCRISTLVISGRRATVPYGSARCFSEVVPSLRWCLHIQAGGGGSTMCTSSACKI